MSRSKITPVRIVAPAEQFRPAARTLRDLLRYAVTRFQAAGLSYGQGTATAFDDASWLLLWSLHLPPDALEPFLDARLSPAEIDQAIALIDLRCDRRLPVGYLTGEAWLHGVRFTCDPRALVPRSLIADLLFEGIEDWLEDEAPARVLDLCTGGGSLAVLCAMRFPLAEVVGSDLSADALALARENLDLHALADRVTLCHGDLWEPLAGRTFDMVVCNPPYVNSGSMAVLPAEFKAEPQSALAGGPDGMDLVRRILAGAPQHLSESGHLLVEIGHEADHFEAAFPGLEFAWLPVPAGDRMVALISASALRRQFIPAAASGRRVAKRR